MLAGLVGWAASPERAVGAPGEPGGAAATRTPAVPGDTIVWDGFLGGPVSVTGPAPRAPLFAGRLGLKPLSPLFAIQFPEAPGLGSLLRAGVPGSLGRLWSARLEASLRTAPELIRLAGSLRPDSADVRLFLPPDPDSLRRAAVGDSAGGGDPLPDFLAENADLQVRLTGRTELGGDWTRFEPCDVGLQFTCNPSLIPQIEPEVQFGLLVQGTIRDRFHIDVDYDQTREFSAANNINFYYQGLEDEILQRVEVGDVSFRLPESRFLTQGIPAGNFGFSLSGAVGPVDFQTVWAQQKGDLSETEFRLSGVGGSQSFVQEDTLVLDDADYVQGQFFFLSDPAALAGHPHVDILSLRPGDAPLDQSPGAEPIQLYRFENDPPTQQQVEGYIQAEAVAVSADPGGGAPADTVRESGWFRYLQPGVDYFVHASGLWIAVRNPLSRDEMLAVTYITGSGDTIGDYNPERIYNQGQRPTLRLLKASGPNHQPGRPTWDHEMHQIYRVSGSGDVLATSVDLRISLGELSAGRTFTRQPTGEDVTFLRLLGLDEESPIDRVDLAFIYKPADESITEQPPVTGTFLVFPTLEPFRRPPPVPSLGLGADETLAILGADANPRIYEDPDPFERRNSGLFRLTLPFTVRSEGVVSTFSLGALGIRDGSERLFLGERQLVSGQDYRIDYDIGQVTLLDAPGLFAASPDGDLRATWEQQSIFQIAPTSVFGMNAHYSLGDRGDLNVLGLYQAEQELLRRPQLGVEPSAILLGGVNGRLRFGAGAVDRLLTSIPGLTVGRESSLQVSGELAVSMPNPNTRDDVFLDDFDATNDIRLPTLAAGWRLGSAPTLREGAEAVLPAALGPSDVARLTWQHAWIQAGADSSRVFEGFLPSDIDQQIRVAGNQRREPALLVTMGSDQQNRFDRLRWASMTTVLSTNGLDLTKSEFLEFYAAPGDSLKLVIDLGTVSEDAMFVDDQGSANGTKPSTGEPWGLGILDQEANLLAGEVWSDETDQRGSWVESCLAERGAIYPVGDVRANCTRGNGRPDSEDLDGDNSLDTAERMIRYVVTLDGNSPFLARSRAETGTPFQLYRVPLRGIESVNVGGLFTEADFRGVRHMRFTLVGAAPDAVVLARMRIVGSRWVKRARDGVVTGIVGDTAATGGEVEVSPVSRISEGTAYSSPPGVVEQLDDPTLAFGGQGVEFSERSLAVRYRDLGPGDRVEIFNRFPQRPRNFLSYREARIWAVAREGDWSPGGALSFFVKVGNDAENFYLRRANLTRAASPDGVTESDWLPEILIDFDIWLDLRRQAEEFLITNPPAPNDPPLTFWNADSTYAVVLKDRPRAPVLAAVREMSIGVWNRADEGSGFTSGEVWVNELRLSAAFRDPGFAGNVNVDFAAGDVLTSRVSFTSQGPFFRQLEGDAPYVSNELLSVNSTLQLGRFTPAGWGIDLPLSVQHTSTGQDPFFLSQSDIRAGELSGLRETGSSRTRFGLAFRKRTPSPGVAGILLDGLDARVGYTTADATSVTTENDSESVDARVAYSRRPEPRELPIVPAFMGGVVRALLPASLEERLLDARLRWSPEQLGWSVSYFDQESRAFRFDQIIRLPGDTAIRPTLSPRTGLETSADLALRPFTSLTASVNVLSTRDLLDPAQAVKDPRVIPLLAAERSSLAGVDLGWETNRSFRTGLNWRPLLTEWLRPSVTYSTVYGSLRNATFLRRSVVAADTTFDLQRNLSAQRSLQASTSIEPSSLGRSLLGERAQADGFARRSLRRLFEGARPLTVSRATGVTSRFNRAVVDPDDRFQLVWGGLDDLRFLDGDTAAVLTDAETWTANGGVRLPLSLDVNLDYRRSENVSVDTRSDRSSLNRVWPSVQARFSSVPLPGFLRAAISRLSVGSGFTRSETEVALGGSGEQRRTTVERRVPMDVSVAWAGGFNVTYRGALQDGEGSDPTGDTDRQGRTHNLTVSGSFTPAGDFGERLDRPIQLALRYAYSQQSDCRITSGSDRCVPFVDQLNRSLNLTLDSAISRVGFGLQMSYVARQSFIGQRPGSTQFQFGFFGQFLYQSGFGGAAQPGR